MLAHTQLALIVYFEVLAKKKHICPNRFSNKNDEFRMRNSSSSSSTTAINKPKYYYNNKFANKQPKQKCQTL
jgi:hypothetical protein